MTDIALFGIFRSGTNYLRTVLEMNYDCRLQNALFGWKHGFYPSVSRDSPMRSPDVPVVVVVKSPTFSIYSLYNYYRQRHKNMRAGEEFDQFLRERIVTFDAFNRHGPEFRFSNPVQLWNTMNWHYASIKPTTGALQVVRYEDALADPERVAAAVAAGLGLTRKDEAAPFFAPEQRTRNMADRGRTEVKDYLTPDAFTDREFYLERGYLTTYSAADLAHVEREVDRDLLARLGYAEI